MPISVRVKDVRGNVEAWEVVLPEPIATIGRQTTCSVVLSDPDKHISRVHLEIESRNGACFLHVNSKVNPVLIDGQNCVPGSVVPLRNGSSISLPPYELLVAISTTEKVVELQAKASAPPAKAVAEDPFAWLCDFGAAKSSRPASSSPPDDPFNIDYPASHSSSSDPQARQTDPFSMDNPSHSSALVEGVAPLAGGGGLPLSKSETAILDPLALIASKEVSRRDKPPRSGAISEVAPAQSLFDPAPTSTAKSPALVDFGGYRPAGSANIDHVHDFNLPFTPPEINGHAPQTIHHGSNYSGKETLVGVAKPDYGARTAGNQSEAQLRAFLEGLGAADIVIQEGQEAQFFKSAGLIMRSSVHGLITLLLARAEVKKELRAEDRTMLSADENNPLKFMTSVDQAVYFLFDPAKANVGAFLPPVKAIGDACDELVAHEMGMVAGVRAGVVGAIHRFDPAEIEKKAGRAIINKRLKLWELFLEEYAKVENDMSDDLNRIFEGDFLRAYSAQVNRMKKTR